MCGAQLLDQGENPDFTRLPVILSKPLKNLAPWAPPSLILMIILTNIKQLKSYK